MSNFIESDTETITLSNGVTDALLEVIIHEAEARADTPSRREITEFFRDQRLINERAPGTVYFSIEDIPWNKAAFDDDKQFLIRCINDAIEHRGILDINYEALIPKLTELRGLIKSCSIVKEPLNKSRSTN